MQFVFSFLSKLILGCTEQTPNHGKQVRTCSMAQCLLIAEKHLLTKLLLCVSTTNAIIVRSAFVSSEEDVLALVIYLQFRRLLLNILCSQYASLFE